MLTLRLFIPCLLLTCTMNAWSPRTTYYGYQDPEVYSPDAFESQDCPTPCSQIRFFLTGDYLYWTAREDGLSYAFSGTREYSFESVQEKGQVFDPEWEWRSGFKVGAGFDFKCSGWEIYLNYTRYKTDVDDHADEQEHSELHKYWETRDLIGNVIRKGSAHWKLHFNTMDLEFANEYNFGRCLSLRPQFGIKGTWQHQWYTVNYFEELPRIYTMSHHQHFWGFGPRLGLTTYLHLNPCYRLFGSANFTAMYGEFFDEREDCRGLSYNDNRELVVLIDHRTHQVIPVFETQIGGMAETHFCCGWNPLYIWLGWELQIWLKQNQFIHLSKDNNDSHGHMYLQGLTAKAKFEF